jgi:hypothetical protein
LFKTKKELKCCLPLKFPIISIFLYTQNGIISLQNKKITIRSGHDLLSVLSSTYPIMIESRCIMLLAFSKAARAFVLVEDVGQKLAALGDAPIIAQHRAVVI